MMFDSTEHVIKTRPQKEGVFTATSHNYFKRPKISVTNDGKDIFFVFDVEVDLAARQLYFWAEQLANTSKQKPFSNKREKKRLNESDSKQNKEEPRIELETIL